MSTILVSGSIPLCLTGERVAKCASSLSLSEQEIRAQYEALAPDFKLRLTW